MHRLLAAIFLLHVSATTCSSVLSEQDFMPESYEIIWNINLETLQDANDQFTGTVKIVGNVPKVSNSSANGTITLHSYVKSHSRVAVCFNSDVYCDFSMAENEELQPDSSGPITIKLIFPFMPNRPYRIEIDFVGSYGDFNGMFKSSYMNSQKETRRIVATQFGLTYARIAFPCFDEPSFKTMFRLQVHISHSDPEELNKYHVLSNAEVKNIQPTGNKTIYEFEQTKMILPTYLLAVIISDFNSTEPVLIQTQNDPIPLRVHLRPDYVDKNVTEYSQTIGKQSFELMSNYTDYVYENNKIDLVALLDMPWNAMENWGVITFRETALLAEDTLTTTMSIQHVVTTVAHEIAHHWFGDLVTLKWWNNVWLNEGFATYFQYYIVSQLDEYKDWKLWEQFVANEIHLLAYPDDAKENSRAINYEPANDAEVDAGFNNIGYAKGATMLRMMSYLLGENRFQEALRAYLQNFQHSSATSQDLIDCLQKQTKLNLTQVMNNWLQEPGYPLVTVTKQDGKYKLEQERFMSTNSSSDTIWHIPLTQTNSRGDNRSLEWFTDKSTTDYVIDNADWYLLNLDNIGYYRVNYDTDNWKALVTALSQDHTNIPTISRSTLISDALNAARTITIQPNVEPKLDYSLALELTRYLVNETEYSPFLVALDEMSFLKDRLSGDEESYLYFISYMRMLLQDSYTRLGFRQDNANEVHTDKLTRELIATWACNVNVQTCVDEAKDLLSQVINNLSMTIDPDVTSVVYCTGVRSGDGTTFDNVLDIYKQTEYAFQKIVVLAGLGCTRDEVKINELLNKASDPTDNDIRQQDRIHALRGVFNGNPENIPIMLDFMSDLSKLRKMMEATGVKNFGKLVTELSAKISTAALRTKFEVIIGNMKSMTDIDFTSTLTTVEETISYNREWEDKYKIEVSNWFSNSSTKLFTSFILLCLSFSLLKFL